MIRTEVFWLQPGGNYEAIHDPKKNIVGFRLTSTYDNKEKPINLNDAIEAMRRKEDEHS